MEKVITFTLQGPSGFIVGTDPIQLLQCVFGSEKGGQIIDQEEKENLFGELEAGEKYVYKIIVEKRYTQKQLDEMHESDGDIH